MKAEVEKIIEAEIRPILRAHVGDIEVINVEEGIVEVKLMGACSGCPHSDITTKEVVEEKLKNELSWVKEVKVIREVSKELIDMAKMILGNLSNK
jgi:Fe-S cluster biogenesis protein NfuA